MKLLQNSGVPIYQQIADSFKADILAGKYREGDYLPSIRSLAMELKISVITPQKLYQPPEQIELLLKGKLPLCVNAVPVASHYPVHLHRSPCPELL